MELLFIVVVLVLLALASARWGADSRGLDAQWSADSRRSGIL
jgi:hypothetical protein